MWCPRRSSRRLHRGRYAQGIGHHTELVNVPWPAEQPIFFKTSTGPGNGKACQRAPGPFGAH